MFERVASISRTVALGGGGRGQQRQRKRTTSTCPGSLLSVDFVVTQFGDQSRLFVDLRSQVGVESFVAGRVVGRLQQLHHLRVLVFLHRRQQQQQQQRRTYASRTLWTPSGRRLYKQLKRLLKFGNISVLELKPNSITLASSELAPNMFGASSELVRSWLRTS